MHNSAKILSKIILHEFGNIDLYAVSHLVESGRVDMLFQSPKSRSEIIEACDRLQKEVYNFRSKLAQTLFNANINLHIDIVNPADFLEEARELYDNRDTIEMEVRNIHKDVHIYLEEYRDSDVRLHIFANMLANHLGFSKSSKETTIGKNLKPISIIGEIEILL